MKVYIAGPYSAKTPRCTELNVSQAIMIGVKLIELGFTVFVPHLSHYLDRKAESIGINIPYDKWIEMDLEWLKHCDVMLVLGYSPGVYQEIKFAVLHRIPMVRSVNELLDMRITCGGV